MAGKMSGAKGMGAARMKGRFPLKKKKAAKPDKAEKETAAEDKVEPAGAEAKEADGEGKMPSKFKKRMFSETY
jgi:hypothetical protein